MFRKPWPISRLIRRGAGRRADTRSVDTRYAPEQAGGYLSTLEQSAGPADLSLPPERLLTAAAFQHAWLAVKRARGGPGVDGVTLARFESDLATELATLRTEMISGTYRPRPLRQVLVPKSGDGLRSLAIWALRDRVAQRVVYDLLAPVFEPHFLDCSFGFRAGLGVEDAVQATIRHRDANRRWLVDGDIRNCFDSIDRRRLSKLIAKQTPNRLLRRLVQRWLDARILSSADGRPRAAGAAQGGVLSPLFANIYLHEMDRRLLAQDLALVRYADDFVICCRRKADAQAALDEAAKAVAKLGLSLHPQKTSIRHFDQGFEWLGYFFIRNECYRL